MALDPDDVQAKRAGHPVFNEVQAALLNSECDPYEAAVHGLCALFAFVGTELAGSTIAGAVEEALETVFFEGAASKLKSNAKPKKKP